NFLTREMPALSRLVAMEGAGSLAGPGGSDLQLETRTPEIHATLDGSLVGLSLQLEAVYGNGHRYLLRPRDGDGPVPSPSYEPDDESFATKISSGAAGKDKLRFWCRDYTVERTAIGEARAGGFTPGDRKPDAWFISGERQVGTFLANHLPRWRRRWRVIEGARMQDLTSRLDYIEPDITLVSASGAGSGRDMTGPGRGASRSGTGFSDGGDSFASSGEDWLGLDIKLRSRNGRSDLSPADVQRWLQTGQSHRREEAGRILLFPNQAWDQMQLVLADCDVRQDPGRQRVRAQFAPYLTNALEAQGWGLNQRSTWRPPEEKPALALGQLPASLTEILRPYQSQGIAWLSGLAQNGLCGLLADEMGLGKTIQMLAFLQQLLKKAGGNALIVCPTSLVHNWRQEAERFTPGLRVLVLEGAGRSALWGEIDRADLIVTSYALLRRDIDQYTGREFTAAVLDEAQHIKNRSSLNAQSAKALRARMRYVLTGTPLENSLQDLWSIFDFLLPNYLGTAKDFKERYEAPITKDKDESAAQRLRQRLRPFFLRRTKKEVALQLPDKLEQVAYCELTDEQREVYQAILEQGRREVFDGSGKVGQGKNKLAILTTLLRLRQACCHLGLLPGSQPSASGTKSVPKTSHVSESKKTAAKGKAPASEPDVTSAEPTIEPEWKEPSGKMDHFLELLDEAIDGGHRILVFSQFVKLLHLVRAELDKRNVTYCYLDGATQNRMDEVKRFQTTADIPVFLISLKAGGVGLNLTAADTVVLFDPWWNPAVEDQAMARAHRIGQHRVVNAYKMIARGTVEEKILKLQEKKQALFASSLATEELFVESLSWDEVKDLFA
ncbi:MAG TPA: DEAD/DEAH box helicase, partial [Candidatus Methylacidiphilales bacterium]|nr:DEAD/DEAH box helicase [Candidatus Methylacidiphilales bacterium]